MKMRFAQDIILGNHHVLYGDDVKPEHLIELAEMATSVKVLVEIGVCDYPTTLTFHKGY